MNVHSTVEPWPRAPKAPTREVGPIVLQIVEGTLNSIEAEIEYAIERTARSPMIREAHDYRVGLFDRYCRKLTGRSYSAMPNAVVRDFPPDTMQPGDVFLMNDTYLSEGSIGHLPDLCSTVPVFHRGEVVAYIQAFGHHDDIGGRVPGSMPGTAATVFEEGLAIPPIKLYSAGARNDAVFTIIRRNTRVPGMLAADLDSEVQACLMGARRMAELFERFGRETVEACFQAILDKCRDIFRRELLPKIADGSLKATLASLEPSGRWDADGIQLEAKAAGGGYTLDGTKLFVPDANVADLFVVAGRAPELELRRFAARTLAAVVVQRDPFQESRRAATIGLTVRAGRGAPRAGATIVARIHPRRVRRGTAGLAGQL